jgi:cell division cycle 14
MYHIFDQLYLAISTRQQLKSMELSMADCTYFAIDGIICYSAFADDFGPMNLGCVHQFCSLVDELLSQQGIQPIALRCESNKRSVTNSAFLLGSYMIMRWNVDFDALSAAFESISSLLVPYRDISFGVQNFHLHVHDCWKGLIKAKDLGWVDFGPAGFDLQDYLHLDSPLNADLHELVPGKFLAMRGPRDLATGEMWGDATRLDGSFSHRDFSPAHYAGIFQQFNVCAVVRLNAPQYDRRGFAEAGIAVADLFFQDCTDPPVDVVAKFLAIAEALPGAIAVHCQAGLGRTGTLVALYMMKHHGFTAREAMGWLRIVRPGSVIGPQQHFLCDREALMRRSPAPLHPASPASEAAAAAAAGGGVGAVQRLIDETIRGYDTRYAAALRVAAAAPPPPLHAPGPDTRRRRALAAHVSAAASRRAGARAALACAPGPAPWPQCAERAACPAQALDQ